MTYGDEYAETKQTRGGARAMADAVRKALDLQPPCWLHPHHGRASHVHTINGEPHAICAVCAEQLTLDKVIARQRAERDGMRGRR